MDLIVVDVAVWLNAKDPSVDVGEVCHVQEVFNGPRRRNVDTDGAGMHDSPVRFAGLLNREESRGGLAKANPDTAVGNNCRNASRWIALEARFWLTGGFESADNFDPEQHREMGFAGFNCVKRRNWVPLVEDCRVRALVRCFDTRSEAHFADPTREQDRSGSAV